MAKTISRLILTVVFLLSAAIAMAKPAPPQKLTAILGEVSEMEEKFEGGNWAGSLETLGEVEEIYVDVYAQHQDLLPADLNDRFMASVQALERFLGAEDDEKTETSFIALQVALFEVMGYFDYKVHPVIGTLKKYIGDEAQEALSEKDFDEVHSELKEVVTFFSKNTTLFQQNGIAKADLQVFMSTLGEAIKQARAEDASALKTSLDALEQQIDAFQAAFSKV